VTRRLLSTAAVLLVLTAHPTVTPAGEPTEAGKPYKATGIVEVKTRNFGDGVGRAYFLRTPDDAKISLFLTDGRQAEILDRLVANKLPARVEGTWYEVNRRPFVIVETIKEITP
jgi:hypothetical protein